METVYTLVREQLSDDNMGDSIIRAYCFEVFRLPMEDVLGFYKPEQIARYIVDYVLLIDDVA